VSDCDPAPAAPAASPVRAAIVEVLARIAHVSQVPVVIVTATANPEQRADLVDDGAVACLGKPFRNDDLRGVVARALGTRPGPH
jgi:CheY-like chemotaxis protein